MSAPIGALSSRISKVEYKRHDVASRSKQAPYSIIGREQRGQVGYLVV